MSATVAAASRGWTDPKYYLWIIGGAVPTLVSFSLILFTVLTHFYGVNFWTELPLWAMPFVVYVVIPLADLVFGDDKANPPEAAIEELDSNPYYRALLFIYIPMQYVVTAWCAWIVVHEPVGVFGYVGAILAAGGVNGLGINTAHELGHKLDSLDRWLSRITLALSAYGHFYVEHNRGHHVRVATPEDPASARLGESFWRFFPRSVLYSAASAWHLERVRLGRRGQKVWSIHNEVLQAWAMTVVVFGLMTAFIGWRALPFLILQAIYAFSLLEVVNYLEHYGLARQRLANGRYEPCSPVHSWNSNHIVTNVFLYHLQRHSDHHANPLRRYQTLRHFEESPQLPSGYATMIVFAYVPPLWYWLMDRRVLAHYNGDLDRANIQPGRRRAIERRLGLAH